MFCDVVSIAQQKNYQVWYHRQVCIKHLGEGVKYKDLAHCAKMIEMDSKNYHVWSYRQWAVEQHKAWVEEDAFVRDKIKQDVRNNSAWNQLFWLGERQNWWSDEQRCKQEIEYALTEARRAPSNESPWLFIQGICRKHEGEVVDVARLQELAEKWILCVPLRALLIFLYEHRLHKYAEAVALANECSEQVDTIRAKYWKYKAGVLQAKIK